MTQCYIAIEPDRAVQCGNCEWTGTGGDLDMVTDIQERIDPGCVVPAGQCPECGALAYITDEPKPRRPYIAEEPDGYLESDLDYVHNNLEACVAFLNSRTEPTTPAERAEKAARDLCAAMSDTRFDAETFAKTIRKEHRTNQQSIFRHLTTLIARS